MGDPRWSVPRPSTGGSDFRAAGILASVTLFIGIFSAPVWGRLADRYGRKMMVLRSCFGIAVFTALRGVSGSVWQLLALRAGMGVVAAYNASTIALVASQTPERRLGYALGWLSSGNLLGRLIGPVIGGGIADITGSYRMPFYWGGAGCFAAFVLCWIIVPERFVRPTETSRTASFASMFGVLIRSGGLLPVFLVLMLAQFGTRAVEPVVMLYVQDMLGPLPNIATLGGLPLPSPAFGHRRGADLGQAQRPDRPSADVDDQPGRRGAVHAAAGAASGLRRVRRRAVGVGGWGCSLAASCRRRMRWSDGWPSHHIATSSLA